MRVLVLGGTWFLGRRIAERLHERGDAVLVVHRGRAEPDQWIPVQHLHTDRHRLADHAQTITEFAPDAVVDSCPLTGADVDAVLPVLPEVPTVVLSSQDVYAAFTGLRTGREVTAVPITEDSELSATPITVSQSMCLTITRSSTSSSAGCAAAPWYCGCR
jgi:hypothetical protein